VSRRRAQAAAFDVAVVGGGPAGVAAALSAAARGARTALIEREPALGGNVANAHVHTICGLYLAGDGGQPRFINAGFPARLAAALAASGGAGPPERAGRVVVLPIQPAAFAACLSAMCAADGNVTCLLASPLRSAELATEEGGSSLLTCAPPGGAVEIEARVVIDTTGDGEVAALGGARFALSAGRELQATSFIFEVVGVPADEFAGFSRLQVSALVARASRDRRLPPGCESVLVRPGCGPESVYLTLNLRDDDGDGRDLLDPEHLARLHAAGSACAAGLVEFLRDAHPAFARAALGACPRRVGVRETRRLVGQHVIDEDDVLRGRRSDDDVALSGWPIELWADHRRATFSYPEAPCGVPLGALRSASHPELAMAGRCLSATHTALGALRVIGTALATGEAAGVAAALAADGAGPLRTVGAAAVRASIAERAVEVRA